MLLLRRNALAGICALLGLSTAPVAQTADLFWVNGELADKVSYQLIGDADEFFVLGISFNAGPTPLAILDPKDPRFLSLGVDALGFWTSSQLDGAGLGLVEYPLLGNPALVGAPLHAQFLTIPGTTTIVDDLSNAVAFALLLPGTGGFTVGDRAKSIDLHTSSTLPDGSVLLAGGVEHTAGGDVVVADVELFDPQTQSFAAAGASLQHARAGHTATTLDDGRVLFLGGRDDTGAARDTGELYDPVAGTFTPTAVMGSPRSRHTATLLADGRVFVAAGVTVDDPDDFVATAASAVAATEIYDPATDTWAAGPSLPGPTFDHAASLLGNGEVLISGGIEVSFLFGFPVQTYLAACHRFEPVGGTLSAAAALPSARANHAQLTPAGDGRALATGGVRLEVFLDHLFLDEVVRYDASLDTWTPLAPLNNPRAFHAVADTGTQLVVVGGIKDIDMMLEVDVPEETVETAPHAVDAWTDGSDLSFPRVRPRVAVIDSGLRVLITGAGDDGVGGLDTTAETFLP